MDYLQGAVVSSPGPVKPYLCCLHAHPDSLTMHLLGLLLPTAIFPGCQRAIVVQPRHRYLTHFCGHHSICHDRRWYTVQMGPLQAGAPCRLGHHYHRYGLFSLVDQNSSTAAWVCFQLLLAAGSGLLAGILLPAMQTPLDESLMALTIGIWAFGRGFGSVWGVAIPSAVFNNECRLRADSTIQDPELVQYLSGGRAYEYATQTFFESVENSTPRQEVVQVFTQSLRTTWLVGVAFGGVGFLITLLEKEIKLRDKLETKYGLE